MTVSGSRIVGRQSDDSDDSLPFIIQPIEENIPPGYDVHTINDNSPQVDYSAGWDLTFVPQQGKPAPGHTFHSTAVVNSSLNLHFNGIQIIVFGLLPPGDEPVSADYSLDSDPPVSRSLVDFTNGTLPVGNAPYFASPNLTTGSHNLTITVTSTSQGRNYTLDYFHVLRPSGRKSPLPVSAAKPHTNVGAIIAGVVSGFVLASTLTLAARWFWRRRRRHPSNEFNQEKGVNEQEVGTIKDYGPYDIFSNLPRLARPVRSTKFQMPLTVSSPATLVNSVAPSDGSASPTIVPPNCSKRGYSRRVR